MEIAKHEVYEDPVEDQFALQSCHIICLDKFIRWCLDGLLEVIMSGAFSSLATISYVDLGLWFDFDAFALYTSGSFFCIW